MSRHSQPQHNPYQAQPECLSVLAPALGLPEGSTALQTQDALKSLLAKARERSLGVGEQKAVELVELATTQKTRHLFPEVEVVFFEGKLKTLQDVKNAVGIIREALETLSVSAASPIAQTPPELSALAPPQPERGLNHISTLLEYVLRKYEVTRGLPNNNEQ